MFRRKNKIKIHILTDNDNNIIGFEVPDKTYEILSKIAKKKKIDVEVIINDIITQNFSPTILNYYNIFLQLS